MDNLELKNIDPEDVEDLLVKVENSFNIKFADGELSHIQSFGEICDHIKGKIQFTRKQDCTTQQALLQVT